MTVNRENLKAMIGIWGVAAAFGVTSLIYSSHKHNSGAASPMTQSRNDAQEIHPETIQIMQQMRDPLHEAGQERDDTDNYFGFSYQEEIPMILKHAQRVGVEPEILMAIRDAEDGASHIAYGIMPQGFAKDRYEKDTGYTLDGRFCRYESPVEKQLCWAAWTVKKNEERYGENSQGHGDFISFLAARYAPVGAANDPDKLNDNWERNVRVLYESFKRD